MKAFLYTILFASILFLPLYAHAEEELNGWTFAGSGGPIDTTFTRVVQDTASQGMYSQSFSWRSDPDIYVEWEKIFPRHSTPYGFIINAWLNVLEPIDSNVVETSTFTIFFGDSVELYGMQSAWLWFDDQHVWHIFEFASDFSGNPPETFDRIRIRMVSGPHPEHTEWLFDNLQLYYSANGGWPPDSIVMLDGFGDAQPTLSVGDEPRGLPFKTTLGQNYPNPFNPSTQIVYTLPQSGHVTLMVYDMLGREVKTLVDEAMSAGDHVVTFDASSLPSGTYFYRLKTREFVETRKMVFMK